MSEKKVVSRNIAIALGIICIILAVSLVGAIADYTSIITTKDYQINQLQTWLSGNETLLNQTQKWLNGNKTLLSVYNNLTFFSGKNGNKTS